MSTTQAKLLTKKYPGIRESPNSLEGMELEGTNRLKAAYQELPDTIENGKLEKVGLTSDGYVVYVTHDTKYMGRNIVYYRIRLNADSVEPISASGDRRNEDFKNLSDTIVRQRPDERFGDSWYISPTEN